MNFLGTKYTAYLLRLWPIKNNQTRVILQNVHTGEQETFGSIDDLFLFLVQTHNETNDHDNNPQNKDTPTT